MARPTNAPQPTRLALAPAILGAIVLLAGLALVGDSAYTWIQYPVAILAIIVCVFAVQGKSWWWLIGLVPIAVLWNPVFPLPLGDLVTRLLTILASAYFVLTGLMVKVLTA